MRQSDRAERHLEAARAAGLPQRFEGVMLWRDEGSPTFHLASVVDDIDFGITHVIRGSDHRANEELHGALHVALGSTPPEVIHHGLLVGADGKKLSKRAEGTTIASLREAGYPAEAVRAYFEELGLPRHDVHLDLDRIRSLSVDVLAQLDDEALAERAGVAVEAAPLLRGAHDLVEARALARTVLDPPGGRAVGQSRDARAVRGAPVAASGHPQQGRGEDRRPGAEGGGGKPAGAAGRVDRTGARAGALGRSARAAPRRGTTARTTLSSVRLYDTYSRSVVELPAAPGPVRMYVCGPTVYARAHIGNARPFVIGMWLRSWLRETGYDAQLVHNITDINDKIYDAAPGASAELAARATEWYLEDTGDLGLGMPDRLPRATECVPQIVHFIEELIESGHAYASGGDVYFRVASFPDYGRLSGQKPDQVEQGEEPSELKEDPRDFALWKANKPATEDTWWDAPWGRGRPGWHIECSAMAEDIFGPASRSTAAGSTSSSRTTRTRSPSRVRSGIRSRRSGRTTACSVSPARRCRSRSGTSRRSARRSTNGAGRRCSSSS